MTRTSITLSEWESRDPGDSPELAGKSLDNTPNAQLLIEELSRSRKLEVRELRSGLAIRAFSFVGRVRIGNLEITVAPKLPHSSLLNLLRYAYGFRQLHRVSRSSQFVEHRGFEDLLVSQLNAEVEELIARGLLRSYVEKSEPLSSPRGRIDIERYVATAPATTATLPCRHNPRIEDTTLNRVLRAGLELAGSMAASMQLRKDSRRWAAIFADSVSSVHLDATTLESAERQFNRLSKSYEPAISIIRLLADSQGVALQGRRTTPHLSGFLFDMNAFFQALLSRFLRDNLPHHRVRDEFRLHGMMQYETGFNPRRRQAPTPRPDFVVMDGSSVAAVLDAKYRDLWRRSLPSEMLYQLVVYASSHQNLRTATILYPATDRAATESRINISDPVYGRRLSQVRLRPVVLDTFEKLILSGNITAARRERVRFAHQLAFGVPSTSQT